MVSDNAPNIVLAGRMISTDRSTFGVICVMANLNQTGEAAGVLATLAASRAEAVYSVAAASVRKHLSTHLGT